MSRHWFRGNLHTHTTNSDGDSPPDVVTAWYRDAGYDFLALTDHDLLTHPDSVKHAARRDAAHPGRGADVRARARQCVRHRCGAAAALRRGRPRDAPAGHRFDPGGRRRAVAQPPQLRLAGLALGHGAARGADAVRGVQRRPRRQQLGQARTAGHGRGVGHRAHDGPPDVRRGHGRRAPLPGLGPAVQQPRPRLGRDPRHPLPRGGAAGRSWRRATSTPPPARRSRTCRPTATRSPSTSRPAATSTTRRGSSDVAGSCWTWSTAPRRAIGSPATRATSGRASTIPTACRAWTQPRFL